MTDEMETILRKSLDAVDRSQKLQIAGLVVFLLLVLLHLFVFIEAVHGGHDIHTVSGRAVGMGIFSVLLMIVACTFGITFFIARMTKRILKAIELSLKP